MTSNERQEGWVVPIDRVDAFTSGAAVAVEVGDIEKELRGLWRKASERAQRTGEKLAVIRACLWNFVVHVAGEADLRRVKPLLDEVSHEVPTRIIVVFESGAPGDTSPWQDDAPMRAFIEANLRPGPGGRREVVAEEITLEAQHVETRRLPGLVRSLLLPDLPTAAFFSGTGLCEGPRLSQLANEAERVIVDTGQLAGAHALGALGKGVMALMQHEGTASHRVEITDLGWLRLSPWLHSVAGLFDDDEARAALGSIDDVCIYHAPAAQATALLLSGWLMSRLGWRLGWQRKDEGLELQGADGRVVRLHLVSDPAAAAGPAGLCKVVLRAGERAFEAGRPDKDRERVRAESHLLVKALGPSGRDPLMLAALRAALTLVPQMVDHGPEKEARPA